MNALSKKLAEKEKRRAIAEAVDKYIEHCDLLFLKVLHDLEGFGAMRMERAYRRLVAEYDWYRERYIEKGDNVMFNEGEERMDTFALKLHLKQFGFDYDAITAQLEREKEEKKKGAKR